MLFSFKSLPKGVKVWFPHKFSYTSKEIAATVATSGSNASRENSLRSKISELGGQDHLSLSHQRAVVWQMQKFLNLESGLDQVDSKVLDHHRKSRPSSSGQVRFSGTSGFKSESLSPSSGSKSNVNSSKLSGAPSGSLHLVLLVLVASRQVIPRRLVEVQVQLQPVQLRLQLVLQLGVVSEVQKFLVPAIKDWKMNFFLFLTN